MHIFYPPTKARINLQMTERAGETEVSVMSCNV